jgi:small subunit ribosomal protein S15
LIEAKIWRLSSYYKEKGVLPEDWSYDPEKLRVELS